MSLQDKDIDNKQQNERSYTLTLTLTQVNTILGGLHELPAKYSISLIDSIKQQCEQQK